MYIDMAAWYFSSRKEYAIGHTHANSSHRYLCIWFLEDWNNLNVGGVVECEVKIVSAQKKNSLRQQTWINWKLPERSTNNWKTNK